MKLLVLTLVAAFGLTAQAAPRAQAQFAKTFAFPLSSVEKIEQSIQDAAARTGKAMKQEVTYQIDSNFIVRCAEDSPVSFDGYPYGCVLQTTVDAAGTQVTLMNMLYMTQSSAQMKEILANTDVNTTETVQFKSLFDGGRGSRYYCNAEGAAGSRAWACYLYFVD